MARYIIDKRYRLRGWYKLPAGLYDTVCRQAVFFDPHLYELLLGCNAGHDFDKDTLSEKEVKFLESLLKEKIIRNAGRWDVLLPEQRYKVYPARYRKTVHWSITGACNLKCRHCFMSAPHAKHGSPTTEQIMDVIDQFEECGIFNVDITGGEPLIRKDFETIVRRLQEKEIRINTIYTNGWLVNDRLLDILEQNGMHPAFQLSFDGIGQHDFLRGVPGAEEKTICALKLLKERNHHVSCSMCVHKGNSETIRDSVKLLAELGVKSLKCGSMMNMGEWQSPDIKKLHLSEEESLEIIERYIPLYFEDGAPLSIMLEGAFVFEKDNPDGWGIYYKRECSQEEENDTLACPVLKDSFYLGPDGMVAPCQGMCDTDFAQSFSDLHSQRLCDILKESEYVRLSYATVGDVRRRNDECRKCEYVDRCAGSCRHSALIEGNNYYGVDPQACYFFKNGWEERITAAAQKAYEAYMKRKPKDIPKGKGKKDTEDLVIPNCY
jgi:radical SAM protein with 4Fe4S-binding SPASM domain